MNTLSRGAATKGRWLRSTEQWRTELSLMAKSKEIQPVHPKGNQLWIFIGRTDAEAPILSEIRDQISRSVVSDSLWPHESQHARPPCPSPTPGVHSDSRPSSQRCYPAISSSVVPFCSCPNPSQHQSLFQYVSSSHEVAKVLEFQH